MAANLNSTQMRRLARRMDEIDKLGADITSATVAPEGRFGHNPVRVFRRSRWSDRTTVTVLAPGEHAGTVAR